MSWRSTTSFISALSIKIKGESHRSRSRGNILSSLDLVLSGRGLARHFLGKGGFYAKLVVDGKEYRTEASATATWSKEFTVSAQPTYLRRCCILTQRSFYRNFRAQSTIRLEAVCKHQHIRHDHVIGSVGVDVLETISNHAGRIEVPLSQPGTTKAVGFIEYTIELAQNTGIETRAPASLSWSTLTSSDVIRRVIFEDGKKGLVPPKWATVLSSLDGLVKATQDAADLHGSAKIAVGAVCIAIKLIIQQVERDERVEGLVATMSNVYDHIQDTNFEKIKAFERTLQRLVKVTSDCAYFIADYSQKAFVYRVFEGAIINVDGVITDFEKKFNQLRIDFLMGSTLQSTHTTLLVLDKVRNIDITLHVQTLPTIENATWRRIPKKFTRKQEEIFDALTLWAQNPKDRLVSIFIGESSEEASLVAHKLCERFFDKARLGSGVSFPDKTGNSCKFLISTIAKELAALHRTFAELITDILAKSPSLPTNSAHFDRQFEDLLLQPLQSLTVVGPVLIVIDGLDRCSDLWNFLEILGHSQTLESLPRNVKFLLTTGPSPEFVNPFIHSAGLFLRLWHTDEEVKTHIIMNSFWRHISNLHQGQQLLDNLDDLAKKMNLVTCYSWLDNFSLQCPENAPPLISLLCEITQPLHPIQNPIALLEPVLAQAREHVPCKLMVCFESYMCFVAILSSRWNQPFDILFGYLKSVVDPAILSWVEEFSEIHQQEGIPQDITTLLQSPADHCRALPYLVLKYLNTALKPNLCCVEFPKFNTDIMDLDFQLSSHVPTTLCKLSQCWAEQVLSHLQASHENHQIVLLELLVFLSRNLLSWIELLSLLGCLDNALKQLQVLLPVLSQMKAAGIKLEDVDFMQHMVSDAIDFIIFFWTPIQDGGLFVHHLIFFTPSNTILHQTYVPEEVVKSGLDMCWSYKFHIPDNHYGLYTMANSPTIASLDEGEPNDAIKFWSLVTGKHSHTFLLPHRLHYLSHFLASPSQNHFSYLYIEQVFIFKPEQSANFEEVKLADRAQSICYTPDGTLLLIRTRDFHLVSRDLRTSDTHIHHNFFASGTSWAYSHLLPPMAVSPDCKELAVWAGRNPTNTIEIYNINSATLIRALEHTGQAKDSDVTQIVWSKDQHYMVVAMKPYGLDPQPCYLWSTAQGTSSIWIQELDSLDSAGFTEDSKSIILASRKKIQLVDCSTLQTTYVIPLVGYVIGYSTPQICGYQGLVLVTLCGEQGVICFAPKAEKPSNDKGGASVPLSPTYKQNIFQNAVKHELQMDKLKLTDDGWLCMGDMKLTWIPLPFRELKKHHHNKDEIIISNSFPEWYQDGVTKYLVLDCKAVEKYFL
ncbi:hypothetical protein BDN72DRAFT_896133 [Pluteus cervinus]|uniref:Uncharacterized protein n=1 Tax=Pluteus cervinus TaxID=181527 RepID=A0ACD3AYN0_9AGAR|nr:hypothetical protein BDN72DRAFT_896133 [Pluteus cervinus]